MKKTLKYLLLLISRASKFLDSFIIVLILCFVFPLIDIVIYGHGFFYGVIKILKIFNAPLIIIISLWFIGAAIRLNDYWKELQRDSMMMKIYKMRLKKYEDVDELE